MTEDQYRNMGEQIARAKALLKQADSYYRRLGDSSRVSEPSDEFYCMAVIEQTVAGARSHLKVVRKQAAQRLKKLVQGYRDAL